MAQHGFIGPHLVFEGEHGLYHGFAHTTRGDYAALTGDFGERWVMETIAFKPYACGTMIQPYIDCALRLRAQGIAAQAIAEIVCETAEGIVHRLWEPLAGKQRPANAYSAKFSVPFGIATALVTGSAGLDAYTEDAARDPRLVAVAQKVTYVIDPDNPYPGEFTGHVKIVLRDGRTLEERQPYMRGGAHARLTRAELDAKFDQNVRVGGWTREQGERLRAFTRSAFDGPIRLEAFRA
jgi:2-methylcitrate dehydratase PrpD